MPDGRPIFGGTYWPREDRKIEGETVPGFKSIIKIVQRFLEERAQGGRGPGREAGRPPRPPPWKGSASPRFRSIKSWWRKWSTASRRPSIRNTAASALPTRKFRGTKFPLPCRLNFLLHVGQRTKNQEAHRHGHADPRQDGPGRHLRSARRRLPSLQHRAHLDRAPLREDALRQRPARRDLRPGLPDHEEAPLSPGAGGNPGLCGTRDDVAGRGLLFLAGCRDAS